MPRKQTLNIKSEKKVSGAGIDAETELAGSPYARVLESLRRDPEIEARRARVKRGERWQ